jgi:hypothetical protein
MSQVDASPIFSGFLDCDHSDLKKRFAIAKCVSFEKRGMCFTRGF